VSVADPATATRPAIVTGASSGIGRATAILLAQLGHQVFAVARDQAMLDRLAAGTPGISPFAQSLSTPEGCAAVVKEARSRLGPISVLVHAAGMGGYHDRPIWESSSQIWREMMAVNLDAAFELVHRIAPDMVEQRWGRVVMVGSTAGSVGAPAMASYSASKAGLIGLVRSVACDLAPHCATCNAVLPGWVKGTVMAERDAALQAAALGVSVDEVWAGRAAQYPAGRVLSADEIAEVIAFLISPRAGGVNGEAITVALGSHW
jgi:3-oxoacyl-[acyl-carrier protein] reductase